MEERIFFNRKEAAAYLGLGLSSFDALTRQPDFPRAIRLQVQIVKFYKPALDAWAAKKAEEAAAVSEEQVV